MSVPAALIAKDTVVRQYIDGMFGIQPKDNALDHIEHFLKEVG